MLCDVLYIFCTLLWHDIIFNFITAARPAYVGTEGCYKMLVFLFIFLNLMRNLWNGQKYFGVKYGRMKDLTGKELSVSFTDIRPGVFPEGSKNWAKSTRFRTWKIFDQKSLYNGDAHEQTTLNHHRSPLKVVKWIGNMGTGFQICGYFWPPTLGSCDTPGEHFCQNAL